MGEIAFDESGNTGQNLLDPTQPVFVSAGVRLAEDDISVLRELLKWREEEELHFVRLRRRRAGLDRVVTFLHSDFASAKYCKWMMIHKPFMVTSKIVDILMEARAYRDGVDLYEDGAHLMTSNMFHLGLPALVGQERFDRLLTLFVEMIRTAKIRPIRRFYALVREMMDENDDHKVWASLALLYASGEMIGDILEMRSITDLDPAVPAFVSVAAAWDVDLGEAWEVVHDDSKPIAFDQDVIECYMTDDVEVETFRESEVAFQLPLGATGIRFAESASVPSLQIADIVASAAAHYWKGVVDPDLRDDAWVEIEAAPIRDMCVGGMWPLPLVTPDQLGMKGFDGRATELASELVARGMRQKYGEDWAQKRSRRR